MGMPKFVALAPAVAVAAFMSGLAQAQTIFLPTIDVTSSRLRPLTAGGVGIGADNGPSIGIVGASTSVMTSEEIERSPAQSLPELLTQQTGVQIQQLFGATNGSRNAVDLRGFGAFAHSNVLILVNGRRYQDFDLQGFDFSSIPVNGIERIEITRGNSGTVLYGDGAVGGVINIVLKKGIRLPTSARIEGGVGSFNHAEGRASLNSSMGPWSTSLFGNLISSSGFRKNSQLRQKNLVSRVDYDKGGWKGYLSLSADDQHQGLPGGLPRSSTALPFTIANPRETNEPLNNADKKSINVAAGVVVPLGAGADLTIDGGVRRKFQQSIFFDYFPPPAFTYNPASAVPSAYINTVMTTSSLTPRLDLLHQFLGVENRLLTGIDIYDTQYNSDRYVRPGGQIVHGYDIRQTTAAAYAMNKTAVTPDLDVSLGGRIQRNVIKARDDYDASADPNAGLFGTNPQAPPLSSGEWQYAVHAGLEYRVNPVVAVFGRVARAFRLPNADERVGGGNPFGLTAPANFALKTQTSYDFEAGVRLNWARMIFETSVYDMYLTDEVHFIPALQHNVNLDPTRRTGWEASAQYQVSDEVRVRGGVAYVRPVFREGPNAGNDIPLVSRWTGHAGASWNIVKKALVLDVAARFWSTRRMDNDQIAVQPLIPANATVDVRIGGEYRNLFWSLAVLNVMDVSYFDYAIASGGFPAGLFGPATPPTIGAFNAYPQPGRSFLFRAGATLP